MVEMEPGNRSAQGSEAEGLRAGAKSLLRCVSAGALATSDPGGTPFSSLAAVASDVDGRPILLTSALASHTRHMESDPRISLLLPARGKGDPLAHPRLTLVGRAEKSAGAERLRLRARFLARHPKSALYADFADFSFWTLAPIEGWFNGGFARAARFEWAALATHWEDARELAEAEAGALEHLNRDHPDALARYAAAFAGRPSGRWRAAALDPEGLDLVGGDETIRIPFGQRVCGAAELRAVLGRMGAEARAIAETSADTKPGGPELG